MCKKMLSLISALSLAGSAWAIDPYIGQVVGSYDTTSAVTATAGSTSDGVFGAGSDPTRVNWGPLNTVNGGGLMAGDGMHHSYAVTYTGWFGTQNSPTGLANPTGRSSAGYAQNWISFSFDKGYDVGSIDLWNGSYSGPTGDWGPGDWALGQVYIDYKVGGVWQLALSTTQLNRLPADYTWFLPTDHIEVNLLGVEAVTITPLTSYGTEHYSQYSGNAVLSEVRFSVIPEPSTMALLLVGAAGLLIRRKS